MSKVYVSAYMSDEDGADIRLESYFNPPLGRFGVIKAYLGVVKNGYRVEQTIDIYKKGLETEAENALHKALNEN